MAIAGPSELVTDAAAKAAESGGSVVDVAIVAALTAMCSDPGVCAPGGGGFLTIDVPGSDTVVIDGYMAFPGIGFQGEVMTRTVSMEYGGGVTTNVDAGSVAVPGAFAAFAEASARFGAMPWSELMEAVAEAIEEGFPLSQTAHTYLLDAGEPIFSQDPVTRAALFAEDTLLQQGAMVSFVDLPPTLRAIGSEGVGLLYGGDLGAVIASDLLERGGRVTLDDLAAYEAVVRPALLVDLRGWSIGTNPAPAVGGVAVASTLAHMAMAEDPLDPATWFVALRAAFEERLTILEREADRARGAERVLRRAGLMSPSTIGVAAVDSAGGAVAATFSAGYGSGVVPKGTGMLMNNSVGEIELLAGGVEAHVPGQRMLSNMAPTVARNADHVLAVGSPGADRITSALAITLVRAIEGGDDLVSAINHPRIHPEFTDIGIRIAAERGLDVDHIGLEVRWYEEPHMYFGGVVGAALAGEDLLAHADPRRVGSVAVV